jgi:hypothetical protein
MTSAIDDVAKVTSAEGNSAEPAFRFFAIEMVDGTLQGINKRLRLPLASVSVMIIELRILVLEQLSNS